MDPINPSMRRVMGIRSGKPLHMTRWLGAVLVLLLVMTAAAKVALSAGAGSTLFNALRVLSAVTALAMAVAARKTSSWMDGPRLALIVVGLWTLPDVYGRVGGDGIEYFVEARSILFDQDLDFANDYQGLGAQPFVSANGRIVSRMPLGVPLLWIPFLAAAHVGAKTAALLGASVTTEGFSSLYQAAATTASFVYAFIGLLVLEGILRERYDKMIAFLSVLAAWLATPAHFYMTANPSMSHSVSLFTAAVFVWSWLRARERDERLGWLLTGLAGGLVLLVRSQDGVLLVLPVVDLLLRRGGLKARLAHLGALAFGPLVCSLAQLGIWRVLYGLQFVDVIFAQSMIAQSGPQVAEFLFSPKHGLLTWTPVVLVGLIGWSLWLRSRPRFAVSIWVVFLTAVAFNSSIGDWWASESFGQRRMLAMTPLFALGWAEALAAVRRRPMLVAGLALGALILWNHQLAYIYNSELAGRRDQAVPLDRLAAAQVDVLYRRLLKAQDRLPRGLWVLLYDNLKGVWLFGGDRSLKGRIDLGDEPPGYYPLVGEGWFEPEAADGVTYRLSRGRRSRLTIPLRQPAEFWVALRARSLMGNTPLRLRLLVNGHDVGSREVSSAWTELRFKAAKELLQPGLNELTLVYSATPRRAIPSFHGKNAAAAVDWLQLQAADPGEQGN